MITISQCTKSLNSKGLMAKRETPGDTRNPGLLFIFKKPTVFFFACCLYLTVVLEKVWDSDYLNVPSHFELISPLLMLSLYNVFQWYFIGTFLSTEDLPQNGEG